MDPTLFQNRGYRFLQTGEGLSDSVNMDILRPYLYPLPDLAFVHDSNLNISIIRQFKEIKKKIIKKKQDLESRTSNLEKYFTESVISQYKVPSRNTLNQMPYAKFHCAVHYVDKLTKKVAQHNKEVLLEQIDLYERMLQLIEYLVVNPKPVVIKQDHLLASREKTLFSFTRPLQRRLTAIKNWIDTEYLYLQLIPPPFRIESLNQRFFMTVVEAGIAARKTNHAYFTELPSEDSLHNFLVGKLSPLVTESMLPYTGTASAQDIRSWVNQSTNVVATYLQTDDADHLATIEILMMRFLFSVTYPTLYPPASADHIYLERIDQYRQFSCEKAGILPKFIPEHLKGRPIVDYFNMDSISRAPAEWLASSVDRLCPMDTAYCISKAHESLSVMAVLRVTANLSDKEKKNFVDQMPGFDDIIGIWVSMLAFSDLRNPKQLLEFIDSYSRLPGFPARTMASVAYLEAALTQLESEFEN